MAELERAMMEFEERATKREMAERERQMAEAAD